MWKTYRQAIHSAIDKLLNGITTSDEKSKCCSKDILKLTLEAATEDSDIHKAVVQRIQDIVTRQNWTDGIEDASLKEEKDCQCLVLILDDNMFYRSMRFEYYQLARKCR